jgi:hypothetical protein
VHSQTSMITVLRTIQTQAHAYDSPRLQRRMKSSLHS